MKISPHLLSLILFITNISFSAVLTSESDLDGLISTYIGDFGNGFQLDRESFFPGLNKDYNQNSFLFGYQLDGSDVSVPFLNDYKDYHKSTSNDLYLGLNKVIKSSTFGFVIKDISLLNKKSYDSNGYEANLMSSYSVDLTTWGVFPKGPIRGIALNLKLYDYKENEYSDFRYDDENNKHEDSLVLSIPFKLKKEKHTEEVSGSSVQLDLMFHETKNRGFLFAGGCLETNKSQKEFVKNVSMDWEKTYLIETISDSGNSDVEIKEVAYKLAIPRESNNEAVLQQGEAHLGFVFPRINNLSFAVNGGFRYAQKKTLSQIYYAHWDGSSNQGYWETGDFYNSNDKDYSDSISVYLESYFNRRFKIGSFNIDIGLNEILTIQAYDDGANNISNYLKNPLYYYKNQSLKDISVNLPVYLSYIGKKLFAYIGWCPQYYSLSSVGSKDRYEEYITRNLSVNYLKLGIVYNVNEKISFHFTPGIWENVKFLKSRVEVKW